MILWKGKIKSIKKMKTGNKVTLFSKDVPDELDLLQYTGDEGHLAFCVDKFKASVLEAIEMKRAGIIDDQKMSQSQRLRGIIFQVFAKKYPDHASLTTQESKDKWADAYNKAMEKEIEDWKTLL